MVDRRQSVTTIRPGGPTSVGLTTDQIWKSALPYRLRMRIEIVSVSELRRIEVTSDGALRGRGIMTFSAADGVTEIRYDWDVVTTEWWMNLLAPFLQGLFRWNHAYVMNAGAVVIWRLNQRPSWWLGGILAQARAKGDPRAPSGRCPRGQRRLDPLRRERHLADPRAGRVEDRVADRGRDDRDRRLARAGGFGVRSG